MIDLLRIAIPFHKDFVVGGLDYEGRATGLIDLRETALRGAKLESGNVIFNDGQFDCESLRHPFESLPSSWSTLSFKIFAGGANYWPHIELKASPAKLLTGHNVYGSVDVRLCVEPLITSFNMAMPRLAEMLDFYSAELCQIDCTFSAHLESENAVRATIAALRNVSAGQTRASYSAHETTVYWGKGSRRKRLKAYMKHSEVQGQIDDLTRLNKMNPKDYIVRQLEALQSKDVQEFSKTALRFEASLFPKRLKQLGFPTRIGDFVEHCEQMNKRHCPIQYLWSLCWQDIFQTFEGQHVNLYNDDQIRDALRQKYSTVTASGALSHAKSDRLFRFVRSLRSEGYDEVKSTTPHNTFYRNIREVTQVIPKAQLINLQAQAANNVIPLVRVINVDFAKQLPVNWREPQPLHKQLQQGLRAVS